MLTQIKHFGQVAVVTTMLALSFSACAGAGTTTGEYIDDSVITTKVKTELLRDPATKGLSINVTTIDGVVHLTGVVASEQEKERAEVLAKQVNGAKIVKNKLTLK